MGRIDGTSRDNDRPAGVADAFQISEHSVEPILANRCRNLFSHHDSGPAGTDESERFGPEVPFVRGALLFSGDGERLARGASAPEGSVVRPAGETGGVGPSAEAGEEVALRVAVEVFGSYIHDAPFIHVAGCDKPSLYEISQPCSRERVDFVVVSSHATTLRNQVRK
jgi:hypothetical protein